MNRIKFIVKDINLKSKIYAISLTNRTYMKLKMVASTFLFPRSTDILPKTIYDRMNLNFKN